MIYRQWLWRRFCFCSRNTCFLMLLWTIMFGNDYGEGFCRRPVFARDVFWRGAARLHLMTAFHWPWKACFPKDDGMMASQGTRECRQKTTRVLSLFFSRNTRFLMLLWTYIPRLLNEESTECQRISTRLISASRCITFANVNQNGLRQGACRG